MNSATIKHSSPSISPVISTTATATTSRIRYNIIWPRATISNWCPAGNRHGGSSGMNFCSSMYARLFLSYIRGSRIPITCILTAFASVLSSFHHKKGMGSFSINQSINQSINWRDKSINRRDQSINQSTEHSISRMNDQSINQSMDSGQKIIKLYSWNFFILLQKVVGRYRKRLDSPDHPRIRVPIGNYHFQPVRSTDGHRSTIQPICRWVSFWVLFILFRSPKCSR